MADIAIFLVEHLGVAALILLAGVLADYIASETLKSAIVNWMSKKDRLRGRANAFQTTLNVLLQGFVERLLTSRIASFGFFFRSSLVSIALFGAVLLVQLVLYPTVLRDEFGMLQTDPLAGLATFVVAIAVNCCLDYCSNVKSYSFLRMAAQSGRVLDTIILFLADLSLTIAMFVLIFPATIATSIYIYDALHHDLEIRIDTSDHTQRIIQIASEEIRNDLKSATGRQFDAYYFDLRVVLSADNSRSFSGGADAVTSAVILTDRGQTEARQAYVSLLSSISKNLKFTPLGRGGVLELKRNTELYDFSDLIEIFYTAKNWVNIERENVLQMLTFLANDVNLGSVAFQTNDVSWQPGAMILYCTDGRFFDVQEIMKIEKLPCDTNAVFPATTIAQQKDMLDIRGLIGAEFPITPFFLTSYSLVFLYYGMIFILAAGSITLRLLQLVYSSGHLNVTNRPFTILSLLALPIIIGLKQVVQLF